MEEDNLEVNTDFGIARRGSMIGTVTEGYSGINRLRQQYTDFFDEAIQARVESPVTPITLSEEEMSTVSDIIHLEGRDMAFQYCTSKYGWDKGESIFLAAQNIEESYHSKVFRFLKGDAVDGITAEIAKEYTKEIRHKKFPRKFERQILHRPVEDKVKPSSLNLQDIVEQI